MKKIIHKICTVSLLLIICVTAGCSKGSSTRQENAAADTKGSVAGIIKEVTDKEYMICMNYSRCYLVADKCGTDYKVGDSVKVDYTGAVSNNYNKERKWKEKDGRVVINEDYVMHIKADEYTEISLWDNDYVFYGSVEKAWGVHDSNHDDIYYEFIPAVSEEEGQANSILGDDRGFVGYGSQINGGEGLPGDILMKDVRARITYDPETMLVTKVEPAEDKRAEADNYVAGIIGGVEGEAYLVNINSSAPIYQMKADKCGTDYKEGDSVKISYTGKLRHYDEDMNRLEDDQFPLTGDKMYIIADNYTGISAWENDYCFYGTLEYIADVRDENGWFGESVDTYFSFVPLDGEDEGAANQMFGQVNNIFHGYASQINNGKGFSRDMSMHDTVAKITYDPETMMVTKVEFGDGKPSETK